MCHARHLQISRQRRSHTNINRINLLEAALFEFSLSSFLLGIAFCAPPGVINAEAIRRGLKGGFWPAFLLELGSLGGDAAWAILALSGGAVLVSNPMLRLSLGLGGCLILLYFAFAAFRDALHAPAARSQGIRKGGSFSSGVLLSLGNPFAIAFWLTVGSSAVTSRSLNPQPAHYAIFFFSFMFGALVWSIFLAGLVARGRQYLNPVLFRWINIACGLFLTYFALQLGWNSSQAIFH